VIEEAQTRQCSAYKNYLLLVLFADSLVLCEDSTVWTFLFTCLLVFNGDGCSIIFSSQVSSSSVDLEIEDAMTEVEFDCIVSDGGIIGIEFGDGICWNTLFCVVNDCWLFVDDDDDNDADNRAAADVTINDGFSSNDDYDDEDEQDDTRNLINTTKEEFSGMKVFNMVPPHIEHSYFKATINDHIKYIHKQTACWLLTGEKSKMSNDWLLRVQQINKKSWLFFSLYNTFFIYFQ